MKNLTSHRCPRVSSPIAAAVRSRCGSGRRSGQRADWRDWAETTCCKYLQYCI